MNYRSECSESYLASVPAERERARELPVITGYGFMAEWTYCKSWSGQRSRVKEIPVPKGQTMGVQAAARRCTDFVMPVHTMSSIYAPSFSSTLVAYTCHLL
jgi:hypothetical protein